MGNGGDTGVSTRPKSNKKNVDEDGDDVEKYELMASDFLLYPGIHATIRGEVWEFLLSCFDRKSRWDLTDEYLNGADEEGFLCSISESNASFDMDVAKILRAMRMKDQFSVGEKIALSKQALIAPLDAAVTELGRSIRIYPTIA
nr:serine/threonine-protein kinase ATR [Tanacetum cinerariifolium]